MPATLKTAIGSYGHTKALKDGKIAPSSVALAFEDISPIIAAFRRMCRGLEFDVCEMAITTYLCAKANNLPFTALPVFLVRAFHNGAVQINPSAGVNTPRDLEGKKVGVRAWTVTTGVWAKDILQNEYGVDLEKVDWVVADEEHVTQYKTPPNVSFQSGANLGEMLAGGELAAAIGIPKVESPNVKPLVENPGAASAEWYKKTGVYPINHTLVVKDELLAANPSLGKDLYDAFKQARDEYVAGLASSTDEADAAMQRMSAMVGDPLPYGIEANRKAMEAIIAAATSQHILTSKTNVEDVFAKGAAGW
ncbi:MAG TPA: ABC transporter substrate-binding protein [Dehalococcoidia bacterium]|nr:ABC transporter substrate-binding protein [Dehalococcoidia bacterium]